MPYFKPKYTRNVMQHLRVRATGRGVALKRPVITTFKARAYMTKLPAFGQRAYSYNALRQAKKELGLK